MDVLATANQQQDIASFSFLDDTGQEPTLRNVDTSIAKCSCGNTYFREVEVFQVSLAHTVIVGQKAPRHHTGTFYLYECLACKRLIEPNLLHNVKNSLSKGYDAFKLALTGKPVVQEETGGLFKL